MAGHLVVGLGAVQAGGNGRLWVGGDVKFHPQFGPGAAGTAFANGRQGCSDGGIDHFNQRLVAHSIGQALFQRRHIDNPRQGFSALRLGIELHVAVAIAHHVHALDGRGVLRVGPGAQAVQELFRCAIECVGAHILGFRRSLWRCDQRHAQTLSGEKQG